VAILLNNPFFEECDAGTARTDYVAATTAAVQASGPADGSCPASGDAFAGVGLTAAEHCEAERCNCCRVLPRNRLPAANGREPRIPD